MPLIPRSLRQIWTSLNLYFLIQLMLYCALLCIYYNIVPYLNKTRMNCDIKGNLWMKTHFIHMQLCGFKCASDFAKFGLRKCTILSLTKITIRKYNLQVSQTLISAFNYEHVCKRLMWVNVNVHTLSSKPRFWKPKEN